MPWRVSSMPSTSAACGAHKKRASPVAICYKLKTNAIVFLFALGFATQLWSKQSPCSNPLLLPPLQTQERLPTPPPGKEQSLKISHFQSQCFNICFRCAIWHIKISAFILFSWNYGLMMVMGHEQSSMGNGPNKTTFKPTASASGAMPWRVSSMPSASAACGAHKKPASPVATCYKLKTNAIVFLFALGFATQLWSKQSPCSNPLLLPPLQTQERLPTPPPGKEQSLKILHFQSQCFNICFRCAIWHIKISGLFLMVMGQEQNAMGNGPNKTTCKPTASASGAMPWRVSSMPSASAACGAHKKPASPAATCYKLKTNAIVFLFALGFATQLWSKQSPCPNPLLLPPLQTQERLPTPPPGKEQSLKILHFQSQCFNICFRCAIWHIKISGFFLMVMGHEQNAMGNGPNKTTFKPTASASGAMPWRVSSTPSASAACGAHKKRASPVATCYKLKTNAIVFLFALGFATQLWSKQSPCPNPLLLPPLQTQERLPTPPRGKEQSLKILHFQSQCFNICFRCAIWHIKISGFFLMVMGQEQNAMGNGPSKTTFKPTASASGAMPWRVSSMPSTSAACGAHKKRASPVATCYKLKTNAIVFLFALGFATQLWSKQSPCSNPLLLPPLQTQERLPTPPPGKEQSLKISHFQSFNLNVSISVSGAPSGTLRFRVSSWWSWDRSRMPWGMVQTRQHSNPLPLHQGQCHEESRQCPPPQQPAALTRSEQVRLQYVTNWKQMPSFFFSHLALLHNFDPSKALVQTHCSCLPCRLRRDFRLLHQERSKAWRYRIFNLNVSISVSGAPSGTLRFLLSSCLAGTTGWWWSWDTSKVPWGMVQTRQHSNPLPLHQGQCHEESRQCPPPQQPAALTRSQQVRLQHVTNWKQTPSFFFSHLALLHNFDPSKALVQTHCSCLPCRLRRDFRLLHQERSKAWRYCIFNLNVSISVSGAPSGTLRFRVSSWWSWDRSRMPWGMVQTRQHANPLPLHQGQCHEESRQCPPPQQPAALTRSQQVRLQHVTNWKQMPSFFFSHLALLHNFDPSKALVQTHCSCLPCRLKRDFRLLHQERSKAWRYCIFNLNVSISVSGAPSGTLRFRVSSWWSWDMSRMPWGMVQTRQHSNPLPLHQGQCHEESRQCPPPQQPAALTRSQQVRLQHVTNWKQMPSFFFSHLALLHNFDPSKALVQTHCSCLPCRLRRDFRLLHQERSKAWRYCIFNLNVSISVSGAPSGTLRFRVSSWWSWNRSRMPWGMVQARQHSNPLPLHQGQCHEESRQCPPPQQPAALTRSEQVRLQHVTNWKQMPSFFFSHLALLHNFDPSKALVQTNCSCLPCRLRRDFRLLHQERSKAWRYRIFNLSISMFQYLFQVRHLAH